MGCHAQIWSDSPLLEPVRESYFSGRPIEWRRVHDLPDFVFFNHAIHVKKGIGCESCHGRVDQMVRVSQVQPLTMGWCLECHRAPEAHLRDSKDMTKMGVLGTPEQKRPANGKLATGRTPNPPQHCSGCHR